MTNKTSDAAEMYFDSGFFCAESVLLAVAENYNVETVNIPQIASGFCGGMARNSKMCGAVTGAVMAAGLILGRKKQSDSNELVYRAVTQFMADFKKEYKSHDCTPLLGIDLSTTEGVNCYKKLYQDGENEKCLELSSFAAGLMDSIIQDIKNRTLAA